MPRHANPFVRDRALILVEAEVVGRTGHSADARLALHLNFEVRPADRQILVELIEPRSAA